MTKPRKVFWLDARPGEMAPNHKLTDDMVRQIRVEYFQLPRWGKYGRKGVRQAAAKYGVTGTVYRRVALRQTWRHVS